MTNTMVTTNEKMELTKELVQEEVGMNQEVQATQQDMPIQGDKVTENMQNDEQIKEITEEVLVLKKKLSSDSVATVIGIGAKLIAAKKLLKHGEFEDWLSKKVDFSQRTATTYMKIAKEFADTEKQKAIAEFGITKIGMLAELDDSKRDEFVKKHDIQSMSTRDLRKEVDMLKKKPGEVGRSDSVSDSIKKRVNNLIKYVNENYITTNDKLSDKEKTAIHESLTNLEEIIASIKRSLEAVSKAA